MDHYSDMLNKVNEVGYNLRPDSFDVSYSIDGDYAK